MKCYLKSTCKRFKNGLCSERQSFCIKKFKIDKLFDLSLVSDTQREPIDLYLDDNACDKEAFDTLSDIRFNILPFVRSGRNLYIYSSTTGNGKTAWSLKLLQSYISNIWLTHDVSCDALFISVPRYLLSIKDAISNNNAYAEHIKKNVLSASLVVWDDIATKGMTEFETENVLSIIDARINMGKSNIFTSNILPQELALYVGDRLASRILGTSELIKFVGKDKRVMKKYGTVTSSE